MRSPCIVYVCVPGMYVLLSAVMKLSNKRKCIYGIMVAPGLHMVEAGRPGGVSGYPRAWYRSIS